MWRQRVLSTCAIAVLLGLFAGSAPAAAATDAGDIPTGDRPGELTLEVRETVRGPAALAVDLSLARANPQEPVQPDCGPRCGTMAARVLFTVNGQPLPHVPLQLGLGDEPVTVLAPEDLKAGNHDVRATAVLSWTPGPDAPGGAYDATLDGPRPEGAAFSKPTHSMGPPALASLGLLMVLALLVGYFSSRER